MIGYYAHSHGSGHCNYANLFAKVFGRSLTVFTDRGHAFDAGTDVVLLDNENPDGTEFDRHAYPEPRALHYAPVNMRKITDRNRSILQHVIERDIRLLIVDVSVEMAMLARLSSVPYAYVRLHGDRSDVPHLNAYEGASFLLAYFPEGMEDSETPPWIRKKTVYLGFISRFMFANAVSPIPMEFRDTKKSVLLHITGFGGTGNTDFGILPQSYDIFSIGPFRAGQKGSGATHLGVVDCVRPYIEHADTIVATCGSNMTSEILSLGKPFLAVPEKRPHREQERIAEILDKLGWAVNATRFDSLRDAVTEFERKCLSRPPHASPSGLEGFRQRLESLDYDIETFVADHAQFFPDTSSDVRQLLTSNNFKWFLS